MSMGDSREPGPTPAITCPPDRVPTRGCRYISPCPSLTAPPRSSQADFFPDPLSLPASSALQSASWALEGPRGPPPLPTTTPAPTRTPGTLQKYLPLKDSVGQ